MPKLTSQKSDTYYINVKAKDRDFRISDGNGLYLLIRKQNFDENGKRIKSRKTWQFRYRINGKENIYTVGDYSDVLKAGEARKKSMELKDLVKQGINLNQQKKINLLNALNTSEYTFEKVARSWHFNNDWKPKHAKNILSRLEKDVFPIIGNIPVSKVTPMNIAQIGESIRERGAADVAKRICQYCERIFDDAITLGLTETNPATGKSKRITPNKVKNREHLKEADLGEFISRLNAEPPYLQNALMTKLHILTFVRPKDLRFATWDEFDLDKEVWTIKADRMKMGRDFITPLSDMAIETLKQLKEITGSSKHLFPGQKSKQPISDVAYIKYVKKLSDNKATPHGFRHTASTILNENGFPEKIIEKQLSHENQNKIAGTYNKAEYLEDRRKMLNYWANYIFQGIA